MEKGRFYYIKKHLISLIESADPTLHVFPDWKINIRNIRKFPIATVRITNATVSDETLGRLLSSTEEGSVAGYTFTIHIFASNCRVEGEPKAKYAQESADKIITTLKQNKRNTTYGIFDISDIIVRESEPSQHSFNISRVIVEGLIWASRPDE